MRTRQAINYADQVTGPKLPPGARRASLVEHARHALLGKLFRSAGSGGGGSALDFNACLGRFCAEMAFSDRIAGDNRALAAALGILAADATTEEPTAWERCYVMGLHALARTVALFHYQYEFAGDDDDAGDAETAVTEPVSTPAPLVVDAELALSGWLRQIPGADSPGARAPRVIARAILRATVITLSPHIRIEQRRTRGRDGKPRTPDYLITTLEITGDLIDSFRRALHAFTLQPLRQPAAYTSGAIAIADPADTSWRNLVDWRIATPFLRKFADACHTPEFLQPMITAVNAQQAVRWRINRQLTEWLRLMAWLDSLPPGKHDAPSWLAGCSQTVRETFAASEVWPPKGIQIKRLLAAGAGSPADPDAPVVLRRPSTHAGARTANPLDNPLISGVFESLGIDAVDRHADNAFYLAWFADFRGRVYVNTPWFSPQGADLQRAMLEFADGQVLTHEGRQALKRHGGGLARRKQVLSDLKIENREVVSYEEREQWIDNHRESIGQSAKNPFANTFWFHASDDPLQFLAFCIEWTRQLKDPSAPCHFPIQIDGSCSGLQHMAALTGSEPLARAVNVKARDDALPADIYTELALAAREALTQGTATRPAAATKAVTEQAYALLRDRVGWITRATAKKVVMTVPYGAGTDSQAEHVLEALIESQYPLREDDKVALEALGQQVIESFKNKPAVAPDRETTIRFALRRLAFCIAVELRRALEEKYPAASVFARTIEHIGTAVLENRGPQGAIHRPKQAESSTIQRMPLAWQTPSGLAVCQPGFGKKRATAEIRLRNKESLSVGFTEYLPQINVSKQSKSLMPNLIHSLDATHLNQTIRAIHAAGIRSFGTIHDCIQCLPNDLPTVETALRKEFAKLYAPANDGSGLPRVLLDWYAWMQLLHDIVRLPSPKHFFRLVLPGKAIAQGFAKATNEEAATALQARIQALPPAQRAILDCLADALCEEATPESKPGLEPRQMPPISDFQLPGEQKLDIKCVASSRYFFS